MISVTVAGFLGQDAELKYTPGGDPLLSFSLASNEKKGGEKTTTWVRCFMFGKRAEAISRYLTKGKSIVVAGTGSVREYESKGEKRTSFDVRVNEVHFMGGNEGHGHPTPPNVQRAAKAAPVQQNFGDPDDEMPF